MVWWCGVLLAGGRAALVCVRQTVAERRLCLVRGNMQAGKQAAAAGREVQVQEVVQELEGPKSTRSGRTAFSVVLRHAADTRDDEKKKLLMLSEQACRSRKALLSGGRLASGE